MYSLGNRWKEGSNGEFQISSLENWADNDSINQEHREPRGLQFNVVSDELPSAQLSQPPTQIPMKIWKVTAVTSKNLGTCLP